jgi:hypothetical protein
LDFGCFKCGRSRLALTKQNLDDCPPPLSIDTDAAEIDLTAADVMALFDGAASGAAQNDTRFYLSGPAPSPSSTLAVGDLACCPAESPGAQSWRGRYLPHGPM